jgi:hypothetical protein
MSYADYLRTQQINRPRIIDRRMALGDASTFIERTKLGASWIQGSTDHVINNQNNPFIPNPSTLKIPARYSGSGAGGRVQDASSYTLTRGARSVGADTFLPQKTIEAYCVRATPAPSLVVGAGGNTDGQTVGLNQGYQAPCSLFRPQGNTQLVVRNPALDRLGVQSREQWDGAPGSHYGTQNPLSPNCTSTMTTANHAVKLIPHGNLNSRPVKADFRTAVMGPQVSQDGSYGRPGKLGGALRRIPYVEKHHGNPNIGHPSKLSYEEVTYEKLESYPIARIA